MEKKTPGGLAAVVAGRPEALSSSGSRQEKPDDLMGLPVEPTGLEGAAFQSRVPFDKMTQVRSSMEDGISSTQVYMSYLDFCRSRPRAFQT